MAGLASPVSRDFPVASVALGALCATTSIALLALSAVMFINPDVNPLVGRIVLLVGIAGVAGSAAYLYRAIAKWNRERSVFQRLPEEDSKSDSDPESLPSIETMPPPTLKIHDFEGQSARFVGLSRGCGSSPHPEVDRFRDILPSSEARVSVSEGVTNGALIWDKIIMIQGPHTEYHLELMGQIVEEHGVEAVVRLGPFAYLEYEAISNAQLYAIGEWPDHGITVLEPIYDLIQELDALQGKIMLHCRGGAGRTGVFAACWRIYQLRKAGQEEVDPAAIVEEMRAHRYGMVQQPEQFRMILDFVEYLNAQNAAR